MFTYHVNKLRLTQLLDAFINSSHVIQVTTQLQKCPIITTLNTVIKTEDTYYVTIKKLLQEHISQSLQSVMYI